MILDIAIGVIVIITMVVGFRKGFVFTFIHTIDWILALAVAFIWSPKLKATLLAKTNIYNWLFDKIDLKFSESLGNAKISYDSLPKMISDALQSLTTSMAGSLAERLADFLFTLICFVALVLLVKFVLWILLGILSKKKNKGFVGTLDGLLGFVVGFIKGFIIVSVLLALMLPVVNLLSPDNIEKVTELLSESVIAKEVYDTNIILLLIRDFMI